MLPLTTHLVIERRKPLQVVERLRGSGCHDGFIGVEGSAAVLDVVRGLGCLGGGLDDPAFVFFDTQDIQPALQVGGGLLMGIAHDVRFHAEESRSHLSDEFFLGIDLPSESVMLEEALAIQAIRMSRRVNQLVKEREVVGLGTFKASKWRHLHRISLEAVAGHRACSLVDGGRIGHFGDDLLGGFDSFAHGELRNRVHWREVDAFDLHRVENGVFAKEQPFPPGFIGCFGFIG